jgi:hypothetical protein
MAEISLLLEKLKVIKAQKSNEEGFFKATGLISEFFAETFKVDNDEIAILLADKTRFFLSFAYPDFLVNAGNIPVSSPDAFAAYVYKTEQAYIRSTSIFLSTSRVRRERPARSGRSWPLS